jgi:hypothetical protein
MEVPNHDPFQNETQAKNTFSAREEGKKLGESRLRLRDPNPLPYSTFHASDKFVN